MKLYVASKGKIVALDPRTGRELWRTELPTSDYRTQVLEHEGRVYATTYGQCYGLDGETGTILWHNKLPGLGFGDAMMSIAGKHSTPHPPPPHTHSSASG